MSVSSAVPAAPTNYLYRLAAGGGALLGAFLLAGAYGHFAAVWPLLIEGAGGSGSARFPLALPGLILAVTGLANLGLCRAMWVGNNPALQVALITNLLAAIYLAYLLGRGVPDHPIGLFLGLVACNLLVLGAIRLGMTWPATGSPR